MYLYQQERIINWLNQAPISLDPKAIENVVDDAVDFIKQRGYLSLKDVETAEETVKDVADSVEVLVSPVLLLRRWMRCFPRALVSIAAGL